MLHGFSQGVSEQPRRATPKWQVVGQRQNRFELQACSGLGFAFASQEGLRRSLCGQS
jgi:hypothetical protein